VSSDEQQLAKLAASLASLWLPSNFETSSRLAASALSGSSSLEASGPSSVLGILILRQIVVFADVQQKTLSCFVFDAECRRCYTLDLLLCLRFGSVQFSLMEFVVTLNGQTLSRGLMLRRDLYIVSTTSYYEDDAENLYIG
jgi:hypothetical protein